MNRTITMQEKKTSRRRLAALLLALPLTLGALPSWAGWAEGLEAFNAGRYAEAAVEWRPLSEAGDAMAQNGMAVLLARGWGVAKDERLAATLYRKAADQGNATAQANLGDLYWNGVVLAKDQKAALAWYRKAAEQGNASGQYSLAWMFENGAA